MPIPIACVAFPSLVWQRVAEKDGAHAMTDSVNRRYFERDDSRLLAKGLNPAAPVPVSASNPDGWQQNGGIVDPQPTRLAPPEPVLRFAGSGHFGSAKLGNWWLRFSEYQRMERIADRFRQPVGYIIRQLCFIPEEWSRMDVMVQAKLIAPLDAWKGVGNIVTVDKGDKGGDYCMLPDYFGERPAEQLYIPGLASETVCRESLFIVHAGFLPSSYSSFFVHRA